MSAPATVPARALRGLLGWWVPTGRIRRSDWWLRYFLVFVLLGLLATVVDIHFFPDNLMFDDAEPDPPYGIDLLVPLPDQIGPVTGVTAIVLFVPNVAALVARLHDRDHSAWWLFWGLVPGIGAVVLFVTIALLGTEPRPNRFGRPPF